MTPLTEAESRHPIPRRQLAFLLRLPLFVAISACVTGYLSAQASTSNLLVNWFRFADPSSVPRLMATPEEIQRVVAVLASGDASHRARLDVAVTATIANIDTLQARYRSATPTFGFDARQWLTEATVLYRIARGVQASTGTPSVATLDNFRNELVQVEMDLVDALQRVGNTTVNVHVGQASNIQPLAVIYDGLYDDFTPAQRQSIASAIMNYGVIPAFTGMLAPPNHGDRKWWSKTTGVNNWSTIIIGGAGMMGSLAIRQADYDGSFSCWPGTSNATAKVTKTFRAHFDAFLPAATSLHSSAMAAIPDMGGMWDEGPGYSHDFVFPLFSSIVSLETARKDPLAAPPVFLTNHAADGRRCSASLIHMVVHFSGPHRAEFTHNDGNWSFTPTAVCYLLAEYARQHDSASAWRAAAWRARDRNPSTWSGLHFLWHSCFDWTQPVTTAKGMADFNPATIPLAHYFHGALIESSGSNARPGSNEHIAVWRQSWTDTTSTGVFFKGGDKRGDRHEHLDTGDFIYDALGVRWNADLGPPVGYPAYRPPAPYTGSTSYSTYPKRAMGQNSIVVNPSRNDYLARTTTKVWLDAVNPDQAMDDGVSSHWAPLQNIETSPGAPVWSAAVNLSTAYARHGIRTTAQGAPADPLRTFTWDRATGELEVRDALHFNQNHNEVFWYWHLPGTSHKPVHLSENRVVLQAMRGSTPVYLNIEHLPTTAAANGGFKYSRIDENLPPNQPADPILWGYDNSATQRANLRKLTLRLTTTGNSIDSTVRVTPLVALTGMSETSAMIQLGLLDSLASTPSNWPFNHSLANAHGGAGLATTAGLPAYQTDAPEGLASLLFDGVDDELRTNISLDPGNVMTIAAWVKPAAGRSNIQTIAANSQSGTFPGYKLYLNNFNTSDGALVFETSNGLNMLKATTDAAAVPSGTWTHVAAVVDRAAGHVRLFVNGSLATIQSACRTDFPSNGILHLGCMGANGNFRYGGGIDDLRLLPRAMSAAEIRRLAHTDAAARWSFQNDLSDTTGNHPAATPVNGPAVSATQIRGGSQSLYIDGDDDVVNLGAIDLGNTFTWSQWVRITPDRYSMQTLLFSRPAGSTTTTAVHLYANSWHTTDRRLILYTSNGTNHITLASAAGAVPFGEWVHIAAAINRSAGAAKLYVNGSEVASGACRTDFSNNVPLFIGSMGGGRYTQNLQGHVDEVRIDRSLLTADRIAGLAERRGAAPAISSVTILPNAPLQGQALTLTTTSSDPDSADHLRYSFLWGDGSAATLWSSNPVSPSKTYAEGPVFTAIARVDDGTWLGETSVPVTITLPPNEPPVITAPAELAASAGQATAPMVFTVGDSFTPAASLVVAAASGNPLVLPDSALVLGGSGTSRSLTVDAPPWASGTVPVTLTVSDGSLGDEAVVMVTFTNNGWGSNWTATADGEPLLWSGGTNWSDARPSVSGPAAVVRFFDGQNLPGASLLSHQDAGNPFILSEWILGGIGPAVEGGAIAITGNPVRMVSPDGTTPASIRLNATAGNGFGYIVGVPVELSANTTFSGDGDADFLFTGVLTGSGALTKAGHSTLTFGGTAPHALGGIWTLAGGTLAFDPGLDQRIPATSSFRFTGSAAWDLGGDAQSIAGLDLPNSTNLLDLTAIIRNGTLNVISPGSLAIGPNTSNTGPVGGNACVLDLSGLAGVTLETPADFSIHPKTYNIQSASATVKLAGASLIKANRLIIGSNAGAGTHTGTLELGPANTIMVDELAIGRSARAIGNLRHLANRGIPATTVIRARNGTSRVQRFHVGEQWGGGGDNTATVDFSGGSVDALIDLAEVGRATANNRPSTATLTIGSDGGVFDANRFVLSMTDSTASGHQTTTVHQYGGTLRAGTFLLGSATGTAAPRITSNQYLHGGATLATASLIAGPSGNTASTSVRALRWNGGTLTTLDDSSDLRVAGRLFNGPLVVELIAGSTLAVPAGRTAVFESTAPLSGAGRLVKSGPGRLVLNAASPTYTGTMQVVGGSLEITGSDAALGSPPASPLADAITLDGSALVLNQGWNGALTLVSPGSPVDLFPALDLSGVTGETVQTHGRIAALGIANQGASNHTAATIGITQPDLPGGVQATATASVTSGRLTSVTLTNPGSGYTVAPRIFVYLTGGSSVTTAPVVTCTVRIDGAVVLNPGHDGDGSAPAVTALGPDGGSAFTATAVTTPAITLHPHRGITLGGNGGTLGVFGAHRIEGPVTGSGILCKTGPGSLTLAGPILHAGPIRVEQGVLSLTDPALADDAPLVVNAGASIHLAHATQDQVGSLVLGGVNQHPGTYHEGNSAGFITGGGSITVVGPAGFTGWIQAEFPGITDANVTGFDKDPDADGLPNGIEFLLGTKPGETTPPEHRPQFAVTPDAVTFIFRSNAAAALLQPTVQSATDLAGPWTSAVHGSGGVTITGQANGFANGIDRVTVRIPLNSTRMFLRLSVAEN